MPYTRTSLTILWLLCVALIAAVAMVTPSKWALGAIVGALLVAPSVLLRSSRPDANAR